MEADGYFYRFGGRQADDAGEADAVGGPAITTTTITESLDMGAGEEGGDVGVQVALALDLVEELRGAGVDGDGAAGALALGDDGGAVGRHLGHRVPDVVEVRHLALAAEVASRDVGAALDEVAGHEAAGQGVEVVVGSG